MQQFLDKNYALGNFVASDSSTAHRTKARFEGADQDATFIFMVLGVTLSTNQLLKKNMQQEFQGLKALNEQFLSICGWMS